MKEPLIRLDKILEEIFASYQGKIKKPAVLVSGGIDSSVIVFWTKKTFPNLIPVCLVGPKSKDKPYEEIICHFLKTRPVWVRFNHQEIKKNLDLVKRALLAKGIKPDLTQLSLGLASYFVFKKISRLGLKFVFSGQGPDVLLGGYHRYRKVKNLNLAILKDLPLLEIDRKREESLAEIFNLKIIYPFLEKKFIDFCLPLPPKLKLHQGKEKYLLRCYGQKIGLPEAIYQRSKKAFQYSSGIQKCLPNLPTPGVY